MLDRVPSVRPLISATMLLIVWELSIQFGVITSSSIPPPSEILPRVIVGIASGHLVHAAVETLHHLGYGFGIAMVTAIPVGMLMGRYVLIRAALRPTINFLRPLPSVAVLPVFILSFGLGRPTISATVAFASGWIMLLNSMDAVARIHETTVASARVFGVRGLPFAIKVLLPAALPQILVGMRIALGIALVVAVVAEMLVGSAGLGAFIVTSQGTMRYGDAFAGVLMTGLLGHALFKIWELAQSRLVPWMGRVG